MTSIKICGISRSEDARLAVECGAWAIGLVFWPHSPRRCELDAAQEIAAELRREVEIVGVFSDATLDDVTAVAEVVPLSILQLHGHEGPAYCREAARRTGAKVMKAARVRDQAGIRALEPFHTELHLLDAHSPHAPGGTGEQFDWGLAAHHPRNVPVVLSGGLTPESVGEGIAAVRPFAVDTASGTEAEPGRKDEAKVRAFFRAVAAADEKAAAA
ncbi:MAG: phosphoribosylanthranilate isomerase [Thermoleophilaceae bacterium]